jgi:nicotinamidase-related amidase
VARRSKNPDLHGSTPDEARTALLLIDVINDLDFDGGEKLLEHAIPMAERIAALKGRAREHGIPAIYVNDNFGRWRSDFRSIVEHALQARGRPVAERLAPEDDDYFVLKPKHSGFFSTSLDTLLDYLGADTVILTGMAADYCVLFTANDAHMRDFDVLVPADCVAAEDPAVCRQVVALMERVLKADVRPADQIDMAGLAGRAR